MTQNPPRDLIDKMIDQAKEDNAFAGYIVLIGHASLTSRAKDDLAWLRGHKTYRQLAVAFSCAIPTDSIVLSPAADNYQIGAVTEYQAALETGTVIRNTIYL